MERRLAAILAADVVGYSRLFLAASLAAADRQAEAEAVLRDHLADHPKATRALVAKSLPLNKESDRSAILDALAKAGMPE